MTESQCRNAQNLLKRFFLLNGIVVPCVMENILLLWALRNGLSAAHTAVLSSFTLLAMPMMLLGKRLSATIGPPRAWSRSWFCRYLFVLAMIPAPWMQGSALEPLVPWLLTVCVFGFFSMRSMGMVNTVPVIGEVASREGQGSFQATTGMYANISYLLTMAAIIGVLRWRDTPAVYQGILLAGSLIGMFSAHLLRRLPDMENLRKSARIGIRQVARHIRKNLLLRRLALSWCATFCAIGLIVPIAMLAVKRGYRVTDDAALFFTLIELVGAILAAYALTIIADHTGPRPILVLGLGLFWVTAGFWAFAPHKFVPVAVGAAFLLGGIGRHSIMLALNHYLLASTATRERIGVSLTLQMLSGAVSGLTGMLVAGGVIRWLSLRMPDGNGLALYQNYYRVVLLLLLPISVVVWRLPKLRNWSVRNVIGLIFSWRDMSTLVTLNALRRGDAESAGVTRQKLRKSNNPRIVLHGAQALESLNDPQDLKILLEKMVERPWPDAVFGEMLLAAAGILGCKPLARQVLHPGEAVPPEIRPVLKAAEQESSPAERILLDFIRDRGGEPFPEPLERWLALLRPQLGFSRPSGADR